MFEQAIQHMLDAVAARFDAFTGLFASAYYFFANPFIPVLLAVVGVIVGAALVRWFFGSSTGIWPGLIAVLAVAYAWAFRKGQRAEQDRRDRAK